MIDEKRLLEVLEKNFYGIGGVEVLKQIINEQPKVGEWIPCSERLPKHDGDYLIQAINDCEGIYMAVSSYDSQYKSFSSDGVEDDNAIAWMDLPKMYEVKK